MGKSLFNGAITFVVAILSLVTCVTSCVDEKFELSEDRLDLNVNIFQEGISIPLGSTQKIILDSLLNQLDSATASMILNMGEEGYAFNLKDTLDVTEDIAGALSEIGGLKAAILDESFSFSLNNIDLSGIRIEGQPISMPDVNLGEMLESLDVEDLNSKLPSIEKNLETITVAVPEVDADALSIDLASIAEELTTQTEIAKLEDIIELPDYVLEHELAATEMSYEDLRSAFNYLNLPVLTTSFIFDPYTVTVPLEFTLPKEIKEVKDIKLHQDASFELVFEIINPLFTSGAIVPELDIDLHELLHIDDIESGIEDGAKLEDVEDNGIFEQHVKDKLIMSSENGWRADHVYHVDRLSLESGDWQTNEEGNLVLKKDIDVTMSGILSEKDLKTTLVHLAEKGAEPMEIRMEILFNDFAIDDVQMEINPISPEIEPFEMPVELEEIDLGTDIVKQIEYIEFDKEYPLNVYVQASLPDAFTGMDIVLKNLKVEFPEGMVVNDEGSVGNFNSATRTLTYENISLTAGLNDDVVIERMNLPALVDNKLSYSGLVKVTAEACAEGVLSSKNLIGSSGEEVTVDVSVKYVPKISDFSVVIDDYDYEVAFDAKEINEPIDKEIAELMQDEPILVSLKKDEAGKNPTVELHLTCPDDPKIQLRGKVGDGLVIDFPDMVRIAPASIKDSYNFNPDGNIMTFTSEDDIPRDISLEIENIAVKAEKVDGKEDAYAIIDHMDVRGGVRLVGTTIHMEDVERLKNNEVKVITLNGNIPDIEPAQFGLDNFEKSIKEDITIGKIEVELPDMITSIKVQELLLKDVYLDLNVDASSVKELVGDANVSVKVAVTLPDMFIVECESEGIVFENNVLEVNMPLGKDGKIKVDGVHVVGLDPSDLDIDDGKISIDIDKIPVTGTVAIENLTVDIESLKDANLIIDIDGALASRVEVQEGEDEPERQILIDKITGNVGLDIDPIKTSVDLSSLAEELNGTDMSFTLDIHTFYLTLALNTNIDVPLKGQLDVTPYFGGQPGETMSPKISLIPEDRKDDCYNIFISNFNPNNPKEGYDGRYDAYKDYQCIELDLISLLYSNIEGQKSVMADSISISVNAGVDPEGLCVIEPNKEYKLTAEYEMGVPIELGSNFAFEYRTKIEDLEDVVTQVFAYGSVGLGGKITNCLPLNLNLRVRPLDSNGNEIPLSGDVGVLKIASCDAKGNPVTSKINFVLSGKGTDLSGMTAVELIFTADAKGAAGAPLRPDGFLQIELSALIPDGVTLDLGELIFSKDEDSDIPEE